MYTLTPGFHILILKVNMEIVIILCIVLFLITILQKEPEQPKVVNIPPKYKLVKSKGSPKPAYDKATFDQAKEMLVACGYSATDAKKLLLKTWTPNITVDEWTRKVFEQEKI